MIGKLVFYKFRQLVFGFVEALNIFLFIGSIKNLFKFWAHEIANQSDNRFVGNIDG